MSSHPNTSTVEDQDQQRASMYIEMEVAVKELVNILLPSNYILQNMERKAELIEGSANVAVRKDELESLVHLVSHAHAVAEKLRVIISAAKLAGDEPALREETRRLEEARVPQPARPQEPRTREELWRKEARELSRPVKVA